MTDQDHFVEGSPQLGSVSQWIEDLRRGDENAAHKIWNRYYRELERLCARKLATAKKRVADEEDAALETFHACFRALQEKSRYPDLRDRGGLWRLLLEIADKKVIDQIRFSTRKKRGDDGVRGDSAFMRDVDSGQTMGFDKLPSESPTPEHILVAAENMQKLLQALERTGPEGADARLQQIAEWRFEGYTNQEIAAKLGCSLPTIERRLRLIREIWQGIINDALLTD